MLLIRSVCFGIALALVPAISGAALGAFAPALPRILSIRIRLAALESPPSQSAAQPRRSQEKVVEFIVETDGEVAARAYGPALFVGDVEVNQSERVGRTTWRFVASDPARFRAGDAISWGWMKDPKSARQRTQFRYRVE